jgi:hypothetical protein
MSANPCQLLAAPVGVGVGGGCDDFLEKTLIRPPPPEPPAPAPVVVAVEGPAAAAVPVGLDDDVVVVVVSLDKEIRWISRVLLVPSDVKRPKSGVVNLMPFGIHHSDSVL